jgi:hypothetical protein
MEQPILENAKQVHEKNPKTFPRDLTGLAVGTYVKVCHLNIDQPERFWVRVDEIEEDRITGIVFNQLAHSWLKHGDTLNFEIDCVYAVYTDTPGTGGEEDNSRFVHAECNAT